MRIIYLPCTVDIMGFVTYRYTLLLLYKLFYNNRKQKRVPNNISDLLTPLSLAMICDKGVYYKSGITIHTSFTKRYCYCFSPL